MISPTSPAKFLEVSRGSDFQPERSEGHFIISILTLLAQRRVLEATAENTADTHFLRSYTQGIVSGLSVGTTVSFLIRRGLPGWEWRHQSTYLAKNVCENQMHRQRPRDKIHWSVFLLSQQVPSARPLYVTGSS